MTAYPRKVESSRAKLTFRDLLPVDCLEASECLSSSAPICHESLGWLFGEMTVTLLLAMHSRGYQCKMQNKCIKTGLVSEKIPGTNPTGI